MGRDLPLPLPLDAAALAPLLAGRGELSPGKLGCLQALAVEWGLPDARELTAIVTEIRSGIALPDETLRSPFAAFGIRRQGLAERIFSGQLRCAALMNTRQCKALMATLARGFSFTEACQEAQAL